MIDVAVGKFGRMNERLVEATEAGRISPRISVHEEEELKDSAQKNGRASLKSITTGAAAVSNDKGETVLMLPTDDQKSESSGVSSVGFQEFGASFFGQFVLLYKRSLQCTLRDMTLTHLRFAIQVLLAVMVSVMYYGIGNDAGKLLDNISSLFVNQFILMFGTVMATCVTCKSLPILAPSIRN